MLKFQRFSGFCVLNIRQTKSIKKARKNELKKINLQAKTELNLVEAKELFLRKCEVKNLSEKTIATYKINIKYLTDFLSEDYPVAKITEETIDELTLSLRERGLKTASINSILRTIRSLLYYLMRTERIKKFKVTLQKEDEIIKETYTEDELRRLLKKPNLRKVDFNEYKIWVLENYLLATGNRISTALNVMIKDVDFDNRLITLRKTKNRKQQIIPMPTSLAEILQEYLSIREGEEDDFLFCNNCGGKADLRTIQQCVKDYNIKRDVNKTSCHLFRHTFAKMWILNGGDAFRLQKMLGHSTLDVTKRYVQMFSNELSIGFDEHNPLEQLNINRGKNIKMGAR